MRFIALREAIFATVVVFSTAIPASARDGISVAGSSTVLPYATIVADMFAEQTGHPIPTVDSGGSGHGLNLFCRGVGPDTIDIANASRPIRTDEVKRCAAAGVSEIIEVRFGFDGIVFASSIDGPAFTAFELEHWYKAMVREIVKDGALVPNPFRNWRDVDPGLPDAAIHAFIPGEFHGTRDVFDERVILQGCKIAGAYQELLDAGLSKDAAKTACTKLRTDGRAEEIDKDYTETLALIDRNPDGVGVFGLAFYENNQDKLKVAEIGGVIPTADTIATGQYPVSRPLFFYVKRAHYDLVPGLKDYVRLFVSDEIAGPRGPLPVFGLVPDPALKETQARIEREQTLDAF